MSKNYTQLSLLQRYQIEALIKAGNNQKHIADIIGVNPSTVSREIRRNVASRGRTAGEYSALNAQRKTTRRHQSKPKQILFTDEMKTVVASCLTEARWSPELISQCSDEVTVSHERIYQWIWECKKSNKRHNRVYKELYQYLRHGKRRRKRGNRKDRRGIIQNRIPISQRPQIVEKRKRIGDVEVDLMMGKGHKGALLVITDRASLHTRLKKVPSKETHLIYKGILQCLNKNLYRVRTMTFDNDQAFSCHEKLKKTLKKVRTFFTRPYCSHDKGTVENRIGVVRRFLPKKTNLELVTDKQIREIENKLNNRPVRKFKYLTPNQVLHKKIALIT